MPSWQLFYVCYSIKYEKTSANIQVPEEGHITHMQSVSPQQYTVQIWDCQFSRDVFMFSWRGLLSFCTVWCRGPQIFQKSRSHLKIPGARTVAWSKFHTHDPQILGATIQNLVTMATWYFDPVFLHPWCSVMCFFRHSSETSEHTHYTAGCTNPNHHFTPIPFTMVNDTFFVGTTKMWTWAKMPEPLADGVLM
jgi:hypothetical protein